MHASHRLVVVVLGIAALLASSIAEAQWVMLARRAVGRVEQMSQQSQQSGGANYDTAAVMLEAPADKVYAAVRARRQERAGHHDHARGSERDARSSSPTASRSPASRSARVGDNLTHMMISSAHTGNQPNAAALVLNGVLRVCKDMNVECTQK